jgi:hypothetical protein
MDSTRAMLLALAGLVTESRLRLEAGRAAQRARGQTPALPEASASFHNARRCLIAAVRAADLPADFRVHDVTLSRDPLAAADQLEELAFGYHPAGPIEAEHETARLAYREVFAAPLTDTEQRQADALANLPAARRDKILDRVERHAHGRDALTEPRQGQDRR